MISLLSARYIFRSKIIPGVHNFRLRVVTQLLPSPQFRHMCAPKDKQAQEILMEVIGMVAEKKGNKKCI